MGDRGDRGQGDRDGRQEGRWTEGQGTGRDRGECANLLSTAENKHSPYLGSVVLQCCH